MSRLISKKLPSNEWIKERISDLLDSIYNTTQDGKNWSLFFLEESYWKVKEDACDIGAIALAISAMSKAKEKSKIQFDMIRLASKRLFEVRNMDGSWTSCWEKNQNNHGVVYNTVCSLQALLDVGYLSNESILVDGRNNVLYNNVREVIKSISWLYSMRIEDNLHSTGYGWGYCEGEGSTAEIAIMPTTNVLLLLKRVYYEILCNQPDCILDPEFYINGSISICDVINEVENMLYGMQSSDGQWGKNRRDKGRVLYTCMTMNVLMAYTNEYKVFHEEKGYIVPKGVLKSKDLKLFENILVYAYKRKQFDISALSMMDTTEIFDTYVQESTDEQGRLITNIIDHENFYEPIVVKAILELIQCKEKLSVASKTVFYKILYSLNESLEKRLTKVGGNVVVRSRRGIYSQCYPLYALSNTISAWNDMMQKEKEISQLISIRSKIRYLVFSFAQLVLIIVANICMNPEMNIIKVGISTLILFVSDMLKEKTLAKLDDI